MAALVGLEEKREAEERERVWGDNQRETSQAPVSVGTGGNVGEIERER